MKIPAAAKAIIRGASRAHVAFFRLWKGKGLGNGSTLVLTTIGRKSGRSLSVPLFYVGEGDRLYIVASFGGNDEPPAWYRNLVANPEVGVEVEGRSGEYRARELTPAEARPIWPKLLAMWPSYASYQKKTKRLIPVVELSRLRGLTAPGPVGGC